MIRALYKRVEAGFLLVILVVCAADLYAIGQRELLKIGRNLLGLRRRAQFLHGTGECMLRRTKTSQY